MRKILTVVLLTFMMFFIVSCADKKIEDDSISVLFYVGRNASKVETYFDVEPGDKIEAPEDPTRQNFEFVGWYKDMGHNEEWDFDVDVVSTSIVLYAKWISKEWDVTFVLNEEVGEVFVRPKDVPSVLTPEKGVNLPTVRRPGGIFKGWILVPQDQYTKEMRIYSSSDNLFKYLDLDEFILYPLFENIKTMITFNKRNSEVPQPSPRTGVEYGSIIDWLPTLPDTETQTFVGWYSKNGDIIDKQTGLPTNDWGIEYLNGDYFLATSSVVTLYARWEDK